MVKIFTVIKKYRKHPGFFKRFFREMRTGIPYWKYKMDLRDNESKIKSIVVTKNDFDEIEVNDIIEVDMTTKTIIDVIGNIKTLQRRV